MEVVMVTGGAGFIASNFIRKLIKTGRYFVINVDKLNYCGTLLNVEDDYNFEQHKANKMTLTNYCFYKADINNAEFLMDILRRHQVDILYHFAAQSHVDVSFGNSLQFVIDNVQGTATLLECARVYGKLKKFIHVSTDECTGDVTPDKEKNVLKYGVLDPTNPYSASKAAAEMMVKSYIKSYKLPAIITRSNNVYGPCQFFEKMIPKCINNLYHNKKIPIYGNGHAQRKYLYVEDACTAYLKIMEYGEIGKLYEMGTENEYSAFEIAKMIISKMKPNDDVNDWLTYVDDRPFHDSRYLVNPKTLYNLGWAACTAFDEGLQYTIEWYINYAIPTDHWSTNKDN